MNRYMYFPGPAPKAEPAQPQPFALTVHTTQNRVDPDRVAAKISLPEPPFDIPRVDRSLRGVRTGMFTSPDAPRNAVGGYTRTPE